MKKVLLALAIVVLVAAPASAVIVVNDTFDTYANQAAFEGTWTPIGTVAPISAELSTAQSVSPTQSVRIPGTATNGQSRNRLTFTETSTNSTSGNMGVGDQLIWSFDFYDSAPTTSPQRNFVNLQDSTAPSGTGQLIGMGFNNNQSGANSGGQRYMGRILGYSPPLDPLTDPDGGPNEQGTLGSGAYFKLNDFGVGSRTLGWHNLKVIITTDDGLSIDFSFFVDNVLAELVSNVGTAASLRSYDNIAIGSALSNGSTEAFVDNMRLEYIPFVIPEAGSFVAVGLVSLLSLGGSCLRRQRRPA